MKKLTNIKHVLEIAEHMGGLPVLAVFDDSDADKAGMQVGDIILSIDGTKLDDYTDYMQAKSDARKTGRGYMAMVIWREDREIELDFPVRPVEVDQSSPNGLN